MVQVELKVPVKLRMISVDGKTSKSIRHLPAWQASAVGTWRMLAKPANQ